MRQRFEILVLIGVCMTYMSYALPFFVDVPKMKLFFGLSSFGISGTLLLSFYIFNHIIVKGVVLTIGGGFLSLSAISILNIVSPNVQVLKYYEFSIYGVAIMLSVILLINAGFWLCRKL